MITLEFSIKLYKRLTKKNGIQPKLKENLEDRICSKSSEMTDQSICNPAKEQNEINDESMRTDTRIIEPVKKVEFIETRPDFHWNKLDEIREKLKNENSFYDPNFKPKFLPKVQPQSQPKLERPKDSIFIKPRIGEI